MTPKSRKTKITPDKNQPLKKLKPHFEKLTILSYRFRFINTEQVQFLLHHKHHERIRIWLNELTKNKYLKRYYKKKLDEEPAAFSLGVMGRKYFLTHPEIKDINHSDLDRVWREYKYTRTFKNHCLFLAHMYISLLKFVKQVGLKEDNLHFFTNTDLKGVKHLIYPNPDAYFIIKQKDGSQKKYFVDVFDWYNKKKEMEKRVWQYIKYFSKKTWQHNMETSFPEIILVFPNTVKKYEMNGFIKSQLKGKKPTMPFYLSTWDEIKHQGINRATLQKVRSTNQLNSP